MRLDRRTMLQVLAVSGAGGLLASPTLGVESDVHVIAEVFAKPEAADDFRKLLVDFVAMSRKEMGCKHYTLLEDPAKPGHFYTFEVWADKGAIDAHLTSPAMAALGPKIKDMLAAPPVITQLKVLTES